MIRSFYYVPGEKAQIIEGIADFDKLSQRKDALLWVDMCKPDDQEQFVLTHDFKFHPLAIEDVIAEKSRTKVDDYERYVFTVFQIVDYIGRDEGLKVAEVNLFLGENYIVTVHWDDHRIFDYLYHRAERDERLLSRGADFLLHTIIDTIVDNYNATLDILEYEVDRRRHPRYTALRYGQNDFHPETRFCPAQANRASANGSGQSLFAGTIPSYRKQGGTIFLRHLRSLGSN
jgi:magnesium transporter